MTDTTSVHLPPEWAPQAALWAGWPRLAEEWGGDLTAARSEIAAFIRAASGFVPVKIACGSREAAASARLATGGAGEVVEIPTGDIWLRDTGPLVTGTGPGRVAQIFRFNGWGGKYLMDGDTETAGAVAGVEQLPSRRHALILEGGGIDADGEGRLLTTRQCLLNPNRNRELSQAEIEASLTAALGVDEFIWLGDGLMNDHTDGHVDNIARFIAPGHVLCQHPADRNDPNAETLQEIERTLVSHGLIVSSIPSPGHVHFGDGVPVPASHMNFTITNRAVLVPVYEDRFSAVALSELKSLFPGREVIGLPARAILAGGGSFHCMTREIPA
ncbi:agmatine deiminase family protein [Hyphomonas sp.]|uniref:agmatine deiminase family protein n=1 Tax=Hyphomonas sp. TaxID=87 RepID=UPI001BCD3CBA|nr:agmatine deiminase family protein [Hyphomonas sp.]